MSRITFDPNAPGNEIFTWGVYDSVSAGSRLFDNWRIFRTRAPALNRFKGFSNAVLWHFEGGKWVEVFRVEDGDWPKCIHGGKTKGSFINLKWANLKSNRPELHSVCDDCDRMRS